MSRSRYYPGRRLDVGYMHWHMAWKRRRDDVRTGVGRVRIYGSRAIKRFKEEDEKRFFKQFFSNSWPNFEPKNKPQGSGTPWHNNGRW